MTAEQKKPEEEAKPEGGKKKFPGVETAEDAISGSWRGIKWLTKYTAQLVRSVLGGAWEGTGGVAGGALVDTGRKIGQAGHEITETAKHSAEEVGRERNIGKLGPIIGGIMSGTATLVGRTLEWPFTVIGGAVKRIATGLSRPVSGLMYQYDEAKGKGGTSSGGEAPK